MGGLRTGSGRLDCPGRGFRIDALQAITGADLDRIALITLVTVIDLRSPAEIEWSGRPSQLLERGTRPLHWPLFSHDVPEDEITANITLGELYITMLERGTNAFGLPFATLTQGKDLSVVIHCGESKDRAFPPRPSVV